VRLPLRGLLPAGVLGGLGLLALDLALLVLLLDEGLLLLEGLFLPAAMLLLLHCGLLTPRLLGGRLLLALLLALVLAPGLGLLEPLLLEGLILLDGLGVLAPRLLGGGLLLVELLALFVAPGLGLLDSLLLEGLFLLDGLGVLALAGMLGGGGAGQVGLAAGGFAGQGLLDGVRMSGDFALRLPPLLLEMSGGALLPRGFGGLLLLATLFEELPPFLLVLLALRGLPLPGLGPGLLPPLLEVVQGLLPALAGDGGRWGGGHQG
jgi:hypothetical protein